MKLVFGFTGHEEVWHGSIDIILSSNGGIPETAASYFDDSQGFVTVASHLNGMMCVNSLKRYIYHCQQGQQ